jgi:hypothetical protein
LPGNSRQLRPNAAFHLIFEGWQAFDDTVALRDVENLLVSLRVVLKPSASCFQRRSVTEFEYHTINIPQDTGRTEGNRAAFSRAKSRIRLAWGERLRWGVDICLGGLRVIFDRMNGIYGNDRMKKRRKTVAESVIPQASCPSSSFLFILSKTNAVGIKKRQRWSAVLRARTAAVER